MRRDASVYDSDQRRDDSKTKGLTQAQATLPNTSPTLLCIDDLPQALELRKATLESRGFSVKLASNGYDAIKMLEEESVAAVLLEYKQEGVDAEAIACHIKKRILWLVDDYVMKSELPEQLLTIIERVHKRLDQPCQRSGAAA
jgi:response regulator RpfG family c-di-GMP phosphodiesterase